LYDEQRELENPLRVSEGPSYFDQPDLLYTSQSTLPDEQKAHRIRVVANMMTENTVLYTIHLSANERDEQIYTEEIRPHLETNLYRQRVLIVKKTIERPFRENTRPGFVLCEKQP
jgi:hypothetical protein